MNTKSPYPETVPERFQDGSHLRVCESDGPDVLYQVVHRIRGGYMVKSPRERSPSPLTDDQINHLRIAHRLSYYPCDPDNDPEHIARVLKSPFESFRPELRHIAMRRTAYCRKVADLVRSGVSLDKCFSDVPDIVFKENSDQWAREDAELRASRKQAHLARRRKPVTDDEPQELKPPSARTLETWFGTWSSHSRDVRVLIPDFSGRGDHAPRYADWFYATMRKCIVAFYLIPQRPTLMFAYKEFEKLCEKEGFLKGARPTYQAFRNFKNRNYNDYEECRLRHGHRRAYLNHTVFQKQERPEKVLTAVEIDHCLIDLIVVDESSGMPIGRPWFTAMIDRCSKMILGGHLSFEVPSYAAVQRCIAHAVWPKVLTGLDLKNPWPCKGIPDFIYVDNGKEFHSKSLKATEEALNTMIRPLPVMSPWLKGTVERLFGTMHVQVYGHKEGKTFESAKVRGDYRSAKRATMTLSDLRKRMVEWIVDEYHAGEHSSLGVPPLQRWTERVLEFGAVTPPPDFGQLIEMTGEIVYRPMGNFGISYLGLTWWHEDFTALRKARGGRAKKYLVRFDPFDLYEVRVWDEVNNTYIRAKCTNQELSMKVSHFAAKQHLKEARRIAKEKQVTEQDIEIAKNNVETAAVKRLSNSRTIGGTRRAARYHHFNGQYLTSIAGDGSNIDALCIPHRTQPQIHVPAGEAPLLPPDNSLSSETMGRTTENEGPNSSRASVGTEPDSENAVETGHMAPLSEDAMRDLIQAKMEEMQ
jgi:putative transposase